MLEYTERVFQHFLCSSICYCKYL